MFRVHNLSVLAYANQFTHWHYRTDDTLKDVLSHAYFPPLAADFNAGDLMTVTHALGEGRYNVTQIYIKQIIHGRMTMARAVTNDGTCYVDVPQTGRWPGSADVTTGVAETPPSPEGVP